MWSGELTKLFTKKHLWRSAIFNDENASKIYNFLGSSIRNKVDDKVHWYFPEILRREEAETHSDQISNFSLKSCQPSIKKLDGRNWI